MKRFTAFFALVLFISWGMMPAESEAQTPGTVETGEDETSLSLGGTFQGRASLVTQDDVEQLGVSVRRMYIRADAQLDNGLGAYVQINAANLDVGLVDALARYEPNENVRFRIGRFVGPQPGAAQTTSHLHVDAIERAAIAMRWAQQFVGGDGRDYGVDARYQNEMVSAGLWLHAGDGSLGNFRPGTLQAEFGPTPLNGAISGNVAVTPPAIDGLEVGGHAGYKAVNEDWPVQNSVGTASGHVYWGARPGSQPIRLKADLIFLNTEVPNTDDTRELGLSFLGAVQPHAATEVFARLEHVNRSVAGGDATGVQFLTGGVSFSPSAYAGGDFYRQRLTLAVTSNNVAPPTGGRLDAASDFAAPLIMLQLQLAF